MSISIAPVFHLEPQGRLANVMIEYMVALKFADLVPGCRISNITIPGWGIHHPSIDSPGPIARERQEQHIDLPKLARQMQSGEIRRIEWNGFGQRLENFLPADRYHSVFRSPFHVPMGFGPDYLVCPVRAEDVLHGPSPDYPLTPVEFYRDVVAMTGLTPVFIGQTDPNPYMDRIRQAFPNAIYREPQANPFVDFETIRQSRHVVVGVSTYIWLAAWLSQTLETIHLAVSGLFNPVQKTLTDLLPLGDPRYRFFLFPINYGLPLDRHAEVHRRLAPYWRLMPHEALRRIIDETPRCKPTLDQMVDSFDRNDYLAAYGDVAALTPQLGPDFPRYHYTHHGYQEGRRPFRLDDAWYASEYPLAAFELAQGDYANFADHYAAIGRARGYRATPP